MEKSEQKKRCYTWGSGEQGALGNSKDQKRKDTSEPVPFQVPITGNIMAVSSGSLFSICVTDTGDVYAFGSNKKNQLGIGAEQSMITIPTRVKGIATPIKMVACGIWHSLLLDTSGQVYASGYNKHGELGLGDTVEREKFSIISNFKGIKKVAAGFNMSFYINDDGILFSSGKGITNGSHNAKDRHSPAIIRILQNTKIRDVEAGNNHSACVSEEGDLYTWGMGEFLQLGHGTTQNVQEPKKVEALNGIKVVQASCTRGEKNSHTGCVDQDGKVYTWGAGYKGKLGHEKTWTHENQGDQKYPKQIEALKNEKIKKIECGGIHSAVLSESGKVFTFGCGSNGRLGHIESDNHIYLYREGYPREVDSLKGKTVLDISCSYYHCICCTNEA